MKITKKVKSFFCLQRIRYCLYSYFSARRFAKQLEKMSFEERLNSHLSLPFSYYRDNQLLHLSELCTFFYKHNDEIVSKFKSTNAQRLLLREVRHATAHIASFLETINKNKTFKESGDFVGIMRDLNLMIRRTKEIIRKFDRTYISEFEREMNDLKILFPEIDELLA